MSDLLQLFAKLSEFYDRNLLWEQLEELYEKASANLKNAANQNDSDDETLNNLSKNPAHVITSLPIIQKALHDPLVMATLLELCTFIRNLRESGKSYDNTYDCWDQVIKVSPRDSYLAFIYALSGLVSLDATNAVYTKLALTATNTYLLTLTIPGAKGFHIFEEDVIAHCLQVFGLIDKIQNPDILRRMSRQQPIEIWIKFLSLCDDLKLLLRYVHFNEHKEARNTLLKRLIDIQYLNHEKGYANNCKFF